MRARWNGATPPAMPSPTFLQRLRLWVRAAWAIFAILASFVLFLPLRGLDILAERLAGRPVMALGPRMLQCWGAVTLPAFGLHYVQHGKPMRGGGAFVANHSSWIDIVVLQRAAAPFMVSKSEVRKWPGLGFMGAAIGTMFIDRRRSMAKEQETALLARLGEGDRMALFPEGTSSDGQRVLPFKSTLFGVFFAPHLENIAVQPMTIRYRARDGLPPALYGWWGEMNFGSHIRDVLAHSTGGVVEVTFHPPLLPADFPDRKLLARAAEDLVVAAFDLPKTT